MAGGAMELEDIKSDLLAIKRMYVLLGANPDDSQVSGDEWLDPRARSVLKRLLDDETERLVAAYWKMVATAHLYEGRTSPELEPVQPKPLPPKSQPHGSAYSLKASTGFSRELKQELNSSVSAWNDRNYEKSRIPLGLSSDKSRTSIFTNGPEERRKRCRVCQEKIVRQQSFGRAQGFLGNRGVSGLSSRKRKDSGLQKSHLVPKQKGKDELRRNGSTAGLLGGSSNISVTGGVESQRTGHNPENPWVKNSDTTPNYFLKEVANAIENIETQLLLLRLCSDGAGSRNDGAFINRNPSSAGPVSPAERALRARNQLDDATGSVPDQSKRHSPERIRMSLTNCQMLHKGRNSCQGKRPSQQEILLNPSEMHQALYKGQDGRRQYIEKQEGDTEHRKIMQPSINDLNSSSLMRQSSIQSARATELKALSSLRTTNSTKLSDYRTGSMTQAANQGRQYVNELRTPCNCKNSATPVRPSKGYYIRYGTVPLETIWNMENPRPPITSASTRLTAPPRQGRQNSTSPKTIVKPTLLDEESHSPCNDLRDCTIHQPKIETMSQNKSPLDQEFSEEEGIGSSTSSCSSCSRTSKHTGISEGDSYGDSESESYLSSPIQYLYQHQSSYASSRSTNMADVSSPEESYGTEEYSTEESDNSYSRQSQSESKGYPRKSHKSDHRANTKKNAIGKLRKYKNKLGLILHHHHHHHHQHHAASGDDSSRSGKRNKTSKWNNLSKMFHNKRKQEAHKKRAVDRRRRAGVSIRPYRNQVGHFHSLLAGLMRHIKHSKKSKPYKNEIRRLKSHPGVHNHQGLSKLHWWQIFNRKRGLKLPNRGRVKLGMKNKRPKLRAF